MSEVLHALFFVLNLLLGLLCVVSAGVLVWQWFEAMRWPLHRRLPGGYYAPGVTLFKPLKGCEARTIECLSSWFEQDYAGEVQILFGVARADDPVVRPLGELIKRFPNVAAELVICPEDRGFNRKVSSLIQMAPHATGEVWVVSDSDILAPRELLKNLIQPLSFPENGAVNCLYKLTAPATLATSFETLGVNADFWSQVVQSLRLDEQNFCLGAVIAVNAEVFRKTGEFEPLANLLADDYHIGNRIHAAGKKIILSNVVVESIAPKSSFAEVWLHQLRWARTIRFERPVSYALSIISNPTLWSVLWLLLGSWGGRYYVCAFVLLLRMVACLDLLRRFTAFPGLDDKERFSFFWMVWFKDLFQTAIWCSAFVGRHVIWRGQRLRVHKGGVVSEDN